MLINETHLFAYQHCDRQVFLDTFGDRNQRQLPSEFLEKLHRDSRDFAHHVMTIYREQNDGYEKVIYQRENWQDGWQKTWELMKQGVNIIENGVLFAPEILNINNQEININLLSHPALLIKINGASKLGNYYYYPLDIKFGKRPKLEYQIVSAFHSYLLGKIQDFLPPTAELFIRDKGIYAVNVFKRLEEVEQSLLGLAKLFLHQQEPEVFISRQKCGLCNWHSSCHQVATKIDHLSLLAGVSPKRYQALKELNITSLKALAESEANDLENYPELTEGIGKNLIKQAQSVLHNQPFIRPSELIVKHKQHLLTAPVEIYFDIEAQPELNLDYLHGVLIIDHRQNQQTFYSLVAETPADEGKIWQEFLNLVWQYPVAPIYHFCEYEAQTIKRLAKVYQTPIYQWQPLLKRCIDLHKLVTQTVILPIESYALKNIAKWLGFQWRNPQANGAQSVCWYEQWLNTGNRTLLENIKQYNEDDCYATYQVKKWLTQFINENS